jgi:murein L,D-transpeptidase YcbB/YkuD
MTMTGRSLPFAAFAIACCLAAPARADTAITTALDNLQGFAPETVAAVRAFYDARGGAPAWTDGNGPTDAARSAIAGLGQAAREGLRPADYRIDPSAPETTAAHAGYDVRLSASLLRYATDLRHGRVAPSKADSELFVYDRPVDGAALLTRLAGTENIARALAAEAPASPVYIRMRRLLAETRALAAAGGWPTVPDGPTLKPGMTDPRIGTLRRRLAASLDKTSAGTGGDTYDAELEVAVRQFQRRHGLAADGAVGPGTLRALNVPVEQRIATIELNMERLRWMPDELGATHVLVNMAAFELDYVDDGQLAFGMRVVVGKPYRMTPIFSDRIRYLDFNPTWTATPKIASNDILPKVRKDPGYLVDNGFEMFAGWADDSQPVDPSTVDFSLYRPGNFPFRLRQKPGPANALGQVKFMFPNEYDIYLHDSPARELYSKTVRTFSSGCIRLEKPLELATLLLRQNGIDRVEIDRIIASGKTTRINLKEPVPVHLTYLTAYIGEGGTVNFRDDVYGRDQRLAKALEAGG